MLNNVTGDLKCNLVTHEKSKTMAIWCSESDGFVCLWLSKSAHNIGMETFLGLSHTSTGLHTQYSFPPSISFSFFFHYLFFFTHKWIFQHSLGGSKRKKKHSMMSLSSNLNVIMQMSFSWSMQQYEHVESTLTVITYIHSRSCLQWMFITAEPFDSMRVPAFKFLTHASESCSLQSVYKSERKKWEVGKTCSCYFPDKLESCCCDLGKLDMEIGI